MKPNQTVLRSETMTLIDSGVRIRESVNEELSMQEFECSVLLSLIPRLVWLGSEEKSH